MFNILAIVSYMNSPFSGLMRLKWGKKCAIFFTNWTSKRPICWRVCSNLKQIQKIKGFGNIVFHKITEFFSDSDFTWNQKWRILSLKVCEFLHIERIWILISVNFNTFQRQKIVKLTKMAKTTVFGASRVSKIYFT